MYIRMDLSAEHEASRGRAGFHATFHARSMCPRSAATSLILWVSGEEGEDIVVYGEGLIGKK